MNPFASNSQYQYPSTPFGNHTNIYGGSMTNVQGDQNIYNGSSISTSHHHGAFNIHNGPLHRTTTYSVAGNLSLNDGEAGIEALFNASDPGASHHNIDRDNPPRCHPETRKSVLHNILSWQQSSVGGEWKTVDENGREGHYEAEQILWIQGPLGAGKSAIAQTISETTTKFGALAASFFFSRGTAERGTARHLFSTVAFQIAMNIAQTRGAIGEAVKRDPSIFHKPLESQARTLIFEPLQSVFPIPCSRSFLVVIDGLDECDSASTQRQVIACIAALVQSGQIPLRFLILSRPEPAIRDALRALKYNCIPLMSTAQAYRDVETFLRSGFRDLRTSEKHAYYMVYCPERWPSDADIATLVKRSGGFFIYAATVLRFVDEEFYEPQIQLQIIMDSSSSPTDAFRELDNLYRQILSMISNTPLLLRILGYILIAKPPPPTSHQVFLTPRVIEIVLELRPGTVLTTLRRLHSILRVGDSTPDAPIECQHASLPHFLFDASRSQKFYIDVERNHADVAHGCLNFINSPAAATIPFDVIQNPRPVIHYILNSWTFHFRRSFDTKSLYDRLHVIQPSQWAAIIARWYATDQRGYWDCYDMLEDVIELLQLNSVVASAERDRLLAQIFDVRSTAFGAHLRQLSTTVKSSRVESEPKLEIPLCPVIIPLFNRTGFLLSVHKDGALSKFLGLQVLEDVKWYEIRKYISFLQVGRSRSAFLDFMKDPQQSKEFFVESAISHAYLAHCCIRLSPFKTIWEIGSRAQDREAYVYAAKYWAKHLSLSTPGEGILLDWLRSTDPAQFLFSASLTIVLAETEVKKKTKWRRSTTSASQPRHILSLLRSIFRGRDVSSNRWRLLFEVDMENIELVIHWLSAMRSPPEDIIARWKVELQKYRSTMTDVTLKKGVLDGDALWRGLKARWAPHPLAPTTAEILRQALNAIAKLGRDDLKVPPIVPTAPEMPELVPNGSLRLHDYIIPGNMPLSWRPRAPGMVGQVANVNSGLHDYKTPNSLPPSCTIGAEAPGMLEKVLNVESGLYDYKSADSMPPSWTPQDQTTRPGPT